MDSQPAAPRRVAVPPVLTPDEARPREGRDVTLTGPTMGVTWSLRARLPDNVTESDVRTAVQSACDTVVAQASTWEPGSDLCRFNRAPAGRWVPVGDHLLAVVGRALDLAEVSDGAFDPTLGALTDLWGFGPAGAISAPPAAEALAAVRPDWRTVRLDPILRRLYQPGEATLDLSGIAKGYGVDLAADAVRGLGVRDLLLDIGGELAGAGVKGSGEPWWVEIERPPDCHLAEPPILIALHGVSIATSGDWRRGFDHGGRRYSHTLDPAAWAPVRSALAAVTVAHARCMDADGLCTALMALGERAPAFAEAQGVAAVLLFRTADGYREHVTPAFAELLD